MRITYLHQYFNTPGMAGGTRSYEMARRLVAGGHEVNMITSWREDDDRGDWFETEESGIHVHWLPVPYSNYMGHSERIRAFLRFALRAARKAASIPTDVVFATSTPLTIALPGAYAKWRRKVPMVFEVRDLWPELPIAMGALQNPVMRRAARGLERFAYKQSDRIIALSPGMRDGVVRAGYPAAKVNVVPNSADLDLFGAAPADARAFRQEHQELGDGPLVVYAGTMGRINGVEYVPQMAASAKAQGSELEFLVVGHGQQEARVRYVAEQKGVLGYNFHIAPAVPKCEIPSLLGAADVALSLFVDLKPMWSNSANKFFDALASGTPVAINYEGWQAELLRETGAGIILPPDSPEQAASELDAFVSDQERLKHAGTMAREVAEQRFDRDTLANELESVLREATWANGRAHWDV